MKDAIRHLKHTQKKVLQSCRKADRQSNSEYLDSKVYDKEAKNFYPKIAK